MLNAHIYLIWIVSFLLSMVCLHWSCLLNRHIISVLTGILSLLVRAGLHESISMHICSLPSLHPHPAWWQIHQFIPKQDTDSSVAVIFMCVISNVCCSVFHVWNVFLRCRLRQNLVCIDASFIFFRLFATDFCWYNRCICQEAARLLPRKHAILLIVDNS